MERTNQGEVPKLSQVIQIDEGKIQEHMVEVVRSTVRETLNAMLDAEAAPCSQRIHSQRWRFAGFAVEYSAANLKRETAGKALYSI